MESVERLFNFPTADWAHATSKTLKHSPAESASDVTVKRPVAFTFAGRAFFFATQAAALEALLAYNVRRLYRKILLVWSKYVKWVQHYACTTRDADLSVELQMLRSIRRHELFCRISFIVVVTNLFAGTVSNRSSSQILQSTGQQRQEWIRKHSDSSGDGRKQCGQRRMRTRGRSRCKGATLLILICSALKLWRPQQLADRPG